MFPTPRLTRDRIWFGWTTAVLCAVIAALIWTFWVGPVNRSVASAEPVEIGSSLSIDLTDNQTIGIWADGLSASLGTMSCAVTGPDGSAPPVRKIYGLGWDDTLWWTTARSGYEQGSLFTTTEAGRHTVSCVDILDTYDGSYLLADDTGTASSIGLGRLGSADFPASAILAFSAVVCPLVAVLLVPIMTVQTLRLRAASRRRVGSSFKR